MPIPDPLPVFAYIDPGTGVTITTAGGFLLALLSGALSFVLIFFKRIFRFFKRNPLWLFILAGLVVLTVLWFFGRKLMVKHSQLSHRIVVLGLDALDPHIMEEMMAAGRLPHFSRLREDGDYRRLATTNPPQSPVAWAAFATGQNPGKTGIYDFIRRDPKTYRIELALANTGSRKPRPVIRSRRFWQYASDRGVPVKILMCPLTFPPDKVNGVVLSGMGVPDVLGTEGTFSFYTSVAEPDQKTTGGQVVRVKKAPVVLSDFLGPRVAKAGGQPEQARVPFQVKVESPDKAVLKYQGHTVPLSVGSWSDWQEIAFPAGWFQKVHGIFRVFLVSVGDEFKMYVSPFNLHPQHPYWPISEPASYSRQLVKRFGLYATQGMPFDTWALNELRIDERAFLAQVEDVMRFRQKLLMQELNGFEKGLFYLYFESPDIVQHMFWRYRDKDHPLYEKNAPPDFYEKIEEWYEHMDKIVGDVLTELNADDVLVVLSDHGFNTFHRAVHLNTWLRENGYLVLKDPAALKGQPLLQDVDWSRTRAYAVGFGSIYVNERGREKHGQVSPGEEKENLKAEIASKLEAWVDAKTQKRVVHRAYRREDVFWGDRVHEAPDILVGYNIGFRASWQTALGDVPAELIEDNLRKWSGSHLFDAALVDGVVFANRKITSERPTIMDIAPTVLGLVGYSSEERRAMDLDGQPLFP